MHHFSLKLGLYKQISNEFMIYVLSSEILFALSHFFFLFRKFEDCWIIPDDQTYNWTEYSQIFFSVYCNQYYFILFKSMILFLNEHNVWPLRAIEYYLRFSSLFLHYYWKYLRYWLITLFASSKRDENHFDLYCNFFCYLFLKQMIENPRLS